MNYSLLAFNLVLNSLLSVKLCSLHLAVIVELILGVLQEGLLAANSEVLPRNGYVRGVSRGEGCAGGGARLRSVS